MDVLDRAIIGSLVDGKKSLPDMIRGMTGLVGVTYEYRKAYEKAKYRIQQMIGEGFIARIGKDYELQNFDAGTATIILMKEDDENTLTLEAGKTVFLNHEKGTTVVFLEETKD